MIVFKTLYIRDLCSRTTVLYVIRVAELPRWSCSPSSSMYGYIKALDTQDQLFIYYCEFKKLQNNRFIRSVVST